MEPNHAVSRRDYLRLGVGAALAGLSGWPAIAEENVPTKPKSVAAVVTVYHRNSHADVLLTKILEGWKHEGGPGPALKLASIYIDQPDSSEFGRKLCEKHGVPRFDSIEQAVTVGGKNIPVDGVLSIGEHGNYPVNELGQQLYPRKRFFQEITDTFRKFGRVVPVFNDKHINTVWEDAKWMYDRAVELKVPFMAGSSLPVAYRSHPFDLPMGALSRRQGRLASGRGRLGRGRCATRTRRTPICWFRQRNDGRGGHSNSNLRRERMIARNMRTIYFTTRVAVAMTILIAVSAELRAEPLFTKQDLFISGHDDVNIYRIPSLIVSPKGTILAFCEARHGDDGDPTNLVLKRSLYENPPASPAISTAIRGCLATASTGNPCTWCSRARERRSCSPARSWIARRANS